MNDLTRLSSLASRELVENARLYERVISACGERLTQLQLV